LRRLAVLGASGHGKVVADAAAQAGWSDITFYDDRLSQSTPVGPWAIAGGTAELLQMRANYDAAVVAIGDNSSRLTKQALLAAHGIPLASVRHPSTIISRYSQIGAGSVILAGAVISAFATVGAGCIINTGATVDHDCVLGDGVHISPGGHLGGGVHIGDRSWVGIGAVIRHDIMVGADVMVGAGAAVVRHVADGLTVVGVPAHRMKRNTSW
jgi:sugar O-acyltransferase (sialic acid O-acetyltransferase NeuD family)